jgi:hypothetical protein
MITKIKFLAAYNATNNLQVIPAPTVDFNFQTLHNDINGTPHSHPGAGEEFDNTNLGTIIVISPNNLGAAGGVDDDNAHDSEMIDAANAINTMAGIGGRAVICCLIYDAIHKGMINPILKFHQQRNENDKARRIKAAFTSPRLSKVAQCVASVIANKPPAQMPVLRGLVNKTMSKTTSAMKRRIQWLKDQLKAVVGKKLNGAKNVKGGKKNLPKGIQRKKGTPAAPQKSAPKKSISNQGVASNDSTCPKGKKNQKKRKASFSEKKAGQPTGLCKKRAQR